MSIDRLGQTVAMLAVPLVLLGNAILIAALPITASALYAVPGFPEPRIEFADGERNRLAGVSVRAVQPWRAGGLDAMRDARRDHGRPAFVAKELKHFADVRTILFTVMLAWLVGLAALLAVAASPLRASLPKGLQWGARLTVGVFILAGLAMLVSFDSAFNALHAVLFEGETWRLPHLGTVRSLFPDEFWALTGGLITVLVLAQAAIVTVFARRID